MEILGRGVTRGSMTYTVTCPHFLWVVRFTRPRRGVMGEFDRRSYVFICFVFYNEGEFSESGIGRKKSKEYVRSEQGVNVNEVIYARNVCV